MPKSSTHDGHLRRRQRRKSEPPPKVGAWLPWSTVENVCRLDLRPSSLWPVFMAVLLTSSRYGGRAAHLGVADLATMTGLSTRTVKRALARLFRQGVLVRQGRYERLQVAQHILAAVQRSANKVTSPPPKATLTRGAKKVALPRCQLAGTSPTCIHVFSLKKNGCKGPFTAKQQDVIADVLTEASELLDADVGGLPLPPQDAAQLGLPPDTTYKEALSQVASSTNRTHARDFTRAVLALRRDPRVQGIELEPASHVDADSVA